MSPSRAWAENYVPKQELGNEIKVKPKTQNLKPET
jgi:hypothetical protein